MAHNNLTPRELTLIALQTGDLPSDAKIVVCSDIVNSFGFSVEDGQEFVMSASEVCGSAREALRAYGEVPMPIK